MEAPVLNFLIQPQQAKSHELSHSYQATVLPSSQITALSGQSSMQLKTKAAYYISWDVISWLATIQADSFRNLLSTGSDSVKREPDERYQYFNNHVSYLL